MRKYKAKIIKTWNPNENGGADFRIVPVVGEIISIEKVDINQYRWSNGYTDCVVPVCCIEIIKEILEIPFYVWGSLIGNKVVYKDGFEFTLKKISIDYLKDPIILIGENYEKMFIVENCKPVLKKIENISEDDAKEFFEFINYSTPTNVIVKHEIDYRAFAHFIGLKKDFKYVLWLTTKGYDVLDLIDSGLALEKKDE